MLSSKAAKRLKSRLAEFFGAENWNALIIDPASRGDFSSEGLELMMDNPSPEMRADLRVEGYQHLGESRVGVFIPCDEDKVEIAATFNLDFVKKFEMKGAYTAVYVKHLSGPPAYFVAVTDDGDASIYAVP